MQTMCSLFVANTQAKQCLLMQQMNTSDFWSCAKYSAFVQFLKHMAITITFKRFQQCAKLAIQ